MSYRLPLLLLIISIFVFSNSYSQIIQQRDTVVVQAFTFDDPSPEGWGKSYRGKFMFPQGPRKWEKILMVKSLKCDSATKGDKYPCGEWDYLTHTVLFRPLGDTVEAFQLGSFVTPYGKRLWMGGEQGWTWIYDLTDYATLLNGLVDIESGNNQELLDLKFLLIPGTPPRDIIAVENIYPFGKYKYEHISDDSLLTKRKLYLRDDAAAYILRARISGHGHAGPRNCCEWDSKTHTYYINDWDHFRWNVWKDCGFNPIYPQGGTWPFDRAGWCPGTKVDEYNFELTKIVNPGDSILFDYGIEPYKDNGEKEGEFRMSHQLISYGPPNFELDVRVEDIIAPSLNDAYSRVNPICDNPIIVIRNTGKYPLKTLDIFYRIKGQEEMKYQWNGNLEFMEKEEVCLPQPDWSAISENPVFEVWIESPNGSEDQYSANNYLYSAFKTASVLPEEFNLYIETNDKGRARENSYFISNDLGEILYEREVFEDSVTYNDKIKLVPGCYEFRLTDDMEDGMNRHWWYRNSNPELVGRNGKIEIRSMEGDTLHAFPYDFGQELLFRFRVR